MIKHTPGPWSIEKGIGHIESKIIGGNGGGGLIADVSKWWFDPATARANARLITAAPELLAAIKRFADLAEREGWEDYRRDAQTLITRIEGEGD